MLYLYLAEAMKVYVNGIAVFNFDKTPSEKYFQNYSKPIRKVKTKPRTSHILIEPPLPDFLVLQIAMKLFC